MKSVQNKIPLLKQLFINETSFTAKKMSNSVIIQSQRSSKNMHKRAFTLGAGAMVFKTLYQTYANSRDYHILFSQGGSGHNNGSNQGGNNHGNGGNQQPGSDHNSATHAQEKKDQDVEVNKYIDQTVLKGGTTWDEVKKVCDEAKEYKFVAVCIPPCFVKEAKKYLAETDVQIATVIGFPFGNTTTEVKVFETRQAIENGADEIDMVINIGWLKSGELDNVGHEIKLIKEACGSKLLKVIVETGYLTEAEISKVTQVVERSGADYIKTSTGFGPRGASMRDVELFRQASSKLKIKAAGGVRDREAAIKYIQLGASRIGTSSGIKLVQKETNTEGKPAQAGVY
ncbi:deoxyribose-phosphate aldolase [Stylonychia lemnae]|uniref:deoxyribose-phosphate aldolase n=1 Tax=Stylonychia lemnae TaxID=5949 RepID=A0A077ZRB7_STYLE|nr:deoxyribose-phosphate aldolase [Stylonychia lemnae]|eukprot:CDW71994.1 deoxyribose-phosphate aldolase [Stylonychia lemnae]